MSKKKPKKKRRSGSRARRRRNPGATTIVLALVGVGIVGGAAYGISRWRRAMRLAPGAPTGGDTVEPSNGGGGKLPTNVPKVYVAVKTTMENGYLQARVVENENVKHYSNDISSAEIEARSFPIDVVFSVASDFDPIKDNANESNDLNLSNNATLVAGTPGVSRDIIVRVKAANEFGSSFSPQVSATRTVDGYSNSLITRIPVYVR